MRKGRGALVSALAPALFLGFSAHAFSQDSSTTEFWPEADVFLGLHSNVRLILSAKRERDAEFRNTEVAADIEVSLHRFRPALTLPWVDQDATRRTLISLRAGYKYKRSFDKTPPVHENRPDIEFTLRWILGKGILVGNRGRCEFRFVNGSPFSWRYRDRVRVERDFQLRGYKFTCYASTEPFYNSRNSTWDQFRFSGGMVLPLGRWFALEPYYLLQTVTDSQPRFTNALGLVAQAHWAR
jgi:hypothetical protein